MQDLEGGCAGLDRLLQHIKNPYVPQSTLIEEHKRCLMFFREAS
jgi:hypothetical protein